LRFDGDSWHYVFNDTDMDGGAGAVEGSSFCHVHQR
jgi:hypothetical protein